jgi:hypothetical protein
MNGAECLVATALANDIDTCFVNPGTTELAHAHRDACGADDARRSLSVSKGR